MTTRLQPVPESLHDKLMRASRMMEEVARLGTNDNPNGLMRGGCRGMAQELAAAAALIGPKPRPAQRRNDGWHLKVGEIGVFVSVGWYDDGAPMELFLDVSAVGSQLRAEFQLVAKLVSHAWQHGQAVNEVCGQMQEVSYYSPGVHASGHETLLGRPVKSILEAVGLVLEHEFKLRGLWKA